jgi:V/A-type H+-transporting ATPase subunit C
MNVCGSQTYLRTRIRILANRLLSDEAIGELMALSLDELEVRFQLQSILQEEKEPQRNSQIIERSLLRLLMLEFILLLRPLTCKGRKLLLHWSRKFELYNLKTLIRGKLNGLEIEKIRDDLYDLPKHIRLPHEALLHAENVLEMLRMLERGPYAAIARQARQVYEEQNEPFSLDAAIDRHYYTSMARHVDHLEVTDKPGLWHLVSTLIDRQNILWLLRYRFAYHFAPSNTYYLLIPTGGRIDRHRLMQLANLESFDALIENLPPRISQLLSSADNSMQIRQRLDLYVSAEARRLIQSSPCVVVAALSYLVVREKELRRLFAIIQGRLLELDDEVIEEAVMGPLASPAMQEASDV